MLEKRIYTRQELIDIYHNTRLDYIKRKVANDGYKYKESGRGKTYTMEIISLPSNDQIFKEYCINHLSFAPQTDFKKLKYFLYNYLTNEDFKNLHYYEMANILKQQFKAANLTDTITADTVSNYCEHLFNADWFSHSYFDYIYYVYDTAAHKNIYISKEEYCSMYKAFWETVRKNRGDYQEASKQIKEKYGSFPKKKLQVDQCIFYAHHYSFIINLIQEDFI